MYKFSIIGKRLNNPRSYFICILTPAYEFEPFIQCSWLFLLWPGIPDNLSARLPLYREITPWEEPNICTWWNASAFRAFWFSFQWVLRAFPVWLIIWKRSGESHVVVNLEQSIRAPEGPIFLRWQDYKELVTAEGSTKVSSGSASMVGRGHFSRSRDHFHHRHLPALILTQCWQHLTSVWD